MFQDLLKKIARCLDAAEIPYMVIGGQAVLFYGEPRLTKDIDITLGITTAQLSRLLKVVTASRLAIIVRNYHDFTEKTMVLPTMDKKTGIRVDFIFSFTPYERQAIRSAKTMKILGTPVKVAALEDIVIHKVISGRARDIEDIRLILIKNPKFRETYITRWLRVFDKSLNAKYTILFKKILKYKT